MPKPWRQIIERLEQEDERKAQYNEEHPPITRISVEEADAQRIIQPVGKEAVSCSLQCFGNNIPKAYSHHGEMVNVFNRGIVVEGYDNPEEGQPAYFGLICALANGRICVTGDERLRRAIEK